MASMLCRARCARAYVCILLDALEHFRAVLNETNMMGQLIVINIGVNPLYLLISVQVITLKLEPLIVCRCGAPARRAMDASATAETAAPTVMDARALKRARVAQCRNHTCF